MTSVIPITLSGKNLGLRHRHLNALVNESTESFEDIYELPEQSPIDRLYKIELASKQKKVNYLLYNLQDQDMLYVSKALKIWLLETEYCDIINPEYLENELYPKMISTAVNKMKQWIRNHLKDPVRCEFFYEYYKLKDFNTAVIYLSRCSIELILKEVTHILHKLSPWQLKLLSEKCFEVVNLFFHRIEKDYKVRSRYLSDDNKYFNVLKGLLKINGNVVLNFTEKYYKDYEFKRFSPEATKYIITNHKNRFMDKPELYLMQFVDMEAASKCLTSDEIKEVVLRLASAKYIDWWFSFKKVAPMIKCLSSEDRTAFKKKVFVDKDVGSAVDSWPYSLPSSPQEINMDEHAFVDVVCSPRDYQNIGSTAMLRKRLIKKKCAKWERCEIDVQMCCAEVNMNLPLTLDQMFNIYRFHSFERTFYELRKSLPAESNPKVRQNMMLVLVSKTGCRVESVQELMKFLISRHMNEPGTLRATVVRSLVRRAKAWRLPEEVWSLILQFAFDLGLDGSPSDVPCHEGLHAAILRCLLNNTESTKAMKNAYMRDFSSLIEYQLSAEERTILSVRLPEFVLDVIKADPPTACEHLMLLLKVLDEYRIRPENCTGVIAAIRAATKQDSASAEPILRRLYADRAARRELFLENFAIIKSEDSHLNALRHDISLLIAGEEFDSLLSVVNCPKRFLFKLSIYFREQDGLASKYLAALRVKINKELNVKLAKSIVILAGDELLSIIREIDTKSEKRGGFAGALRANGHLARPQLNVETFGWHAAGLKAIANRLFVCKSVDTQHNLSKLIESRRTLGLALYMALRLRNEVSVFEKMAVLHPSLAVKTALKYYRKYGDESNPRVWYIIKPLITQLDLNKNMYLCFLLLKSVNNIPVSIRPEYCIIMFNAVTSMEMRLSLPILCHVELLLPGVPEELVNKTIEAFMQENFLHENVSKYGRSDDRISRDCLYVRILAKYLLTCKNEDEQKQRLQTLGVMFFNSIKDMLENTTGNEYKTAVMIYINNFLHSMKYSPVFLELKYVSCMPVFETVVTWMREILPVEEFFSKYVHMHLTMLYYKSIRQAVEQKPEHFESAIKKIHDGTETVGFLFGKYIAREVDDLVAKYFKSITEIYQKGLKQYMFKYFHSNDNVTRMWVAMLKGILSGSKSEETTLLAKYILEKVNVDNKVKDTIMATLQEHKSEEIKFFLFADQYTY